MQPKNLCPGDEVRVIAPCKSLKVVSEDNRKIANKNLEKMGLKVTFGKHVSECDLFGSSSIKSRITDLHDAFLDPNVKGILMVLGGYNSNQLLSEIDYELIRKHPKIFCGFSDITALQNAFLSRSSLLTYSGPHYSSFAMKEGLALIIESYQDALFKTSSYDLLPSKEWSSDSDWFLNQEKRVFLDNSGPKIINPGTAEGTIIGGNLGTFLLLKGTPYMPSLKNTILFVEDTGSSAHDFEFDRNLQSLIDLPEFSGIKALVIGRFEKEANMDAHRLQTLIKQKRALNHLPIVYDLDFGHTTPFFTFPIGGQLKLKALEGQPVKLTVLR